MKQDRLIRLRRAVNGTVAIAAMSVGWLVPNPSMAVTGKVETGAEYRGVYRLRITNAQGPTTTCTGVAVRPRIVMTSAHCMVSGATKDGARLVRKVEVQEGKDAPVIAASASIHVSPTYERFVRERIGYSHVDIKDFVTYSSDVAGLADQAFVVLDRPVAHSPSLFDLLDLKAIAGRDGKEGAVEAEDVRAYARLLKGRFYDGNDKDPIFVGYGHASCTGGKRTGCTGEGTKRSGRPDITFGEGCRSQMYTLSYFCFRGDPTHPGDSGGPLFLRDRNGKRYAVGVLGGGGGDTFVPSMLWSARLFDRVEKGIR